MPATIHLDSLAELQDLYDGIAEDWRDINFLPWAGNELDRMADFEKGLFQSQSDPDGNHWKANAPRTIAEKGHSRILRGRPSNNERLSRSLTQKGLRQSTGDAIREAIQQDATTYVTLGTGVEYSQFNEDRPHIGINDRHLDGVVDRAADFALNALEKA